MKLKRILAGVVAGCLLVGTVIGNSIVGSADDTVFNEAVDIGASAADAYELKLGD